MFYIRSKYFILILLVIVMVSAVCISSYVLFFMGSPVSVELINSNNGGNIFNNNFINNNIPESALVDNITSMARYGTPVVKFGNGEGPVSVVIAGVHGDQLSPQIAALKLIEYLDGKKIKGTVYVIPFAVPSSTELNQKEWNGQNPNKIADDSGSPTNDIVNFAVVNNADVTGDFHSSKPGGDPGVDTIMCTQYPTSGSYQLAMDISKVSIDFPLNYFIAGWYYDGAVEDTLNLKGIPSITGISVSPHGIVTDEAVNTTFNQMIGLLKANNNI